MSRAYCSQSYTQIGNFYLIMKMSELQKMKALTCLGILIELGFDSFIYRIRSW